MNVLLLLVALSGTLAEDAVQMAMKGQDEAAIEALEELITESPQDAALHYNLGTVYLSRNEIGRAVQHLASATRLDPADDDAWFNLASARSQVSGQMETGTMTWQDVALRIPSGLVSILCLASLIALLLLEFARKRLPPGLRKGLAAFACLSIVICIGGLLAVHASETRTSWVAISDCSALVGPQKDAAVAFEVKAGLLGDEKSTDENFIRLALPGGVEAWFDRANLAEVETP